MTLVWLRLTLESDCSLCFTLLLLWCDTTHTEAEGAGVVGELRQPQPCRCFHHPRINLGSTGVGRRGNGWSFTCSLLPDVRVPPVLVHSLLTEPSGRERASDRAPPSIHPAIHPGGLPSGPTASETAWELAAISAHQPSWSRFGCSWVTTVHEPPHGTWGGHIWVVVAPQSDWMQVCALHVVPKPALDPDMTVHRRRITSCKSQAFAISARPVVDWSICLFLFIWWKQDWRSSSQSPRCPGSVYSGGFFWFVFFVLFFFCSLSQTRNRRLPDIYPQYCSSHHPQPDSHSLQGKMQGSLHSLLDVEHYPPRRRATCWLKLAQF